jgi:hypothetical protein
MSLVGSLDTAAELGIAWSTITSQIVALRGWSSYLITTVCSNDRMNSKQARGRLHVV